MLTIGGQEIRPGERVKIDLHVAELYTHTPVTMPVEVVRGKLPGPTMFVSAAIHGDEINGVEIVRRLLHLPQLARLKGTLIAVPIVNVHGFLSLTRYCPDRRDLNRSFPGSVRGSVAGRLANLFATEIVTKADCGIDLHTGAIHRGNLPQIRANLDDPMTAKLAKAFGTPVNINANLRDGSLREFAASQGVPMLLYEAGEALRFDETCIRAGVRGVTHVMRELGMLPQRKAKVVEPVVARSSSWVRAEQSGILRPHVGLGARVKKGDVMATVSDPFGHHEVNLTAHYGGIVIGRLNLPLVNEGDAVFHVARFESTGEAESIVDEFHVAHELDTIHEIQPPVV